MPVTYLVNRNIVGNPILGSNIAGSTSSNIVSIVADPSGNVYVGGSYSGTGTNYIPVATSNGPASGGSSSNVLTVTASAGLSGGFFAKYLSNGATQYYLGIVGAASSNVRVQNVTLDSTSSNLFVSFSYQSTTAFSIYSPSYNTPGATSTVTFPASAGSAGTYGIGFLKITASTGVILWGAALDSGVASDNDTAIAVTVDQNGNSYLLVTYNSTTSGSVNILNGALGTLSSASTITVTLAAAATASTVGTALIKFGPSGIAQWAASTINTSTSGGIPGTAPANTIGVDTSGNVVIAVGVPSGTSTTVNQGSTNGSTSGQVTVPSQSGTAAIIVKYTTNGLSSAPIAWCAVISGSSGNYFTPAGVTCGPYNSVYVTGAAVGNPVVVYNGNGQNTAPSGSSSYTSGNAYGIVIKFSSNNGAFQYASYLSVSSTIFAAYPNSSDTDLYLVANYYNTTGTTTFTNSQGPASGLILPITAAYLTPVLVRMFLGNPMSAEVIPVTASSSLVTVYVDPSATNVYAAGNYVNTAIVTLNNSNNVGAGTPSTVVLPATAAITTGFWVKYA